MNRRAVQRFYLTLLACLALAACSNTNQTSSVPVGQTGIVVMRLVAANGAPDTAFGGTGTAVIDPDAGQFDFALAVALQPDGKILSGGRTVFQGLNSIALIRQNTNGALDTSFNPTGTIPGIVRTPILGVSTSASAIAVQGDGKILVAAISFSQGSSTTSITLVRYTSTGGLDTSFNSTGIVTASLGPGADSDTCGLALQPDGKIVVAGASSNGKISLYRYTTTGALDTAGFGTPNGAGGVTVTDLGAPAMSPAIALQADGKIVLVGGKGSFSGNSSPVDQVVVRYNTDGQLDTTFGATQTVPGIVVTDIGARANFGNALLVQPDQKIVTVGHAFLDFGADTSDISLVRYNTDGTLDTSFIGPLNNPNPGIVTTDLGGFDNAFSIALQPTTGKFIVSGNSGHRGLAGVAVLRYNADGSLDSTFGTGGVVAPPLVGPSFISSGNAVVVQPDGNIVVAGYD